MNSSVSRPRRVAFALFIVAFVVLVAGYHVGKQVAQRDDARAVQTTP